MDYSHGLSHSLSLLQGSVSPSALCFFCSIPFQSLPLSSSCSLAVSSLFPSFLYSNFHFLWNVLAFNAGFILPSPSAALVFLNIFRSLLLGESKSHFFHLLPPLSAFQFPSFTLWTWNQTILVSLEADTPATISSFQPQKGGYHAVWNLSLLLNTSISGKVLSIENILQEQCYRKQTHREVLLPCLVLSVCGIFCPWRLAPPATIQILKGVSRSLRVLFSVKSSISLSGLRGNKAEITKLSYQHCLYTNLPYIVFPVYFNLGRKGSTLRCVFPALFPDKGKSCNAEDDTEICQLETNQQSPLGKRSAISACVAFN